MTTAWQQYVLPIDDMNAAEETEHSYDREIDTLHSQDMAENGLQAQLQRAGCDLNIWQIPDDSRHRLLQLLTELQSYPAAVAHFLHETKQDASRCQ